MSKILTLVALFTVRLGAPDEPVEVPPGREFQIETREGERLIARGFARLADKQAPRVVSPGGDVVIPADWQHLKADELVDLARRFGAKSDVNRKDEAAAFIATVVADRAAAANL